MVAEIVQENQQTLKFTKNFDTQCPLFRALAPLVPLIHFFVLSSLLFMTSLSPETVAPGKSPIVLLLHLPHKTVS